VQNVDLIIELTSWVLHNNYFQFGKESFWLQLRGTAMGTPLAVTFACIYMSELEIEIWETLKRENKEIPSLYFRFIDDVFAVFTTTDAANIFMNTFNNARKLTIKLICTRMGNIVDFLDITISMGEQHQVSHFVDISLYQKPLNSYLYLPPCSFHHKSVFKFTIKSEIRRYCINCTSQLDFLKNVNLFKTRLLTRGYDEEYLNTCIDTTMCRQSLLQELTAMKSTPTNETAMPTIFKTFNTPREHRINIKDCIALPESIWTDPDATKIFIDGKSPIVCYKRTKNLKDEIISSRYNFLLKTDQD
jgi:hypothetical protein